MGRLNGDACEESQQDLGTDLMWCVKWMPTGQYCGRVMPFGEMENNIEGEK